MNIASYCLDHNLADWPDKPALLILGPDAVRESATFGTFRQTVSRVAARLVEHGLQRGDRVVIRLDNEIGYAVAFFGIVAAGLVAVNASASLTVDEVEFLIGDSAARMVIAAPELALPTLPSHCTHVARSLFQRWCKSGPQAPIAATQPDDPAYLIYTSGTTGRPKGVLHAHRSVLGRRSNRLGWTGLEPFDRLLHAGKLNWTYTLGVGLTDTWAAGGTALLYDGPADPTVWPRLISRHRVSIFAAVPTVFRQILKYSTELDHLDLSCLRHGLTAGEPLSSALLTRWRDRIGCDLYEALGMSEVSTYISSGPATPIRPGSPGRPQPGRRVAILPVEPADGDQPLGPGATGLLAVHRSDPGLMLRYWHRPDEEATVYRGEWFVGGDLARFDADGYLWFEGRADDVMNSLGHRVSPVEIEQVLSRMPQVGAVAVTEVPVRPEVTLIAAFVVLRTGAVADEDAVIAFAAEHLAPYKCPKAVRFLPELPKTANGKVLRRRLVEFWK